MWMRCGYWHGACDLVAPISSKHWLRAPSLLPEGGWIVRCPFHWNTWSLRISIGRTNESRRLMAEALAWGEENQHMKLILVEPDETCEDIKYLKSWARLWD